MAKGIEQDVITNGTLFISPIEFFCGDNVTLTFDFVVTEGTALDLEATPVLSYTTEEEIQKIIKVDDTFSVNSIILEADKSNVTIKMECTFWKPEQFKLPPIKIALKNENLIINVPEFTVTSILKKTHSTSIRPYKDPEIVPGSTYIVWGEVIFILGVIAAIITACIKINKIKAFFQNIKKKIRYRKNYRIALKTARQLLKNSKNYTDQDYCAHLQNILRHYLSVRFNNNVYNLTTSEIITWFNDIFGKLLPSVAEKSISLFYNLMYRCDFIRFSGDSVPEAKMQENERESLLNDTIQVIDYFEEGLIEC